MSNRDLGTVQKVINYWKFELTPVSEICLNLKTNSNKIHGRFTQRTPKAVVADFFVIKKEKKITTDKKRVEGGRRRWKVKEQVGGIYRVIGNYWV